MKRSWFTISIVAGLAILMAALGVLQYRWVVSASEAEADRMRKRAGSDAERFAADFNREIQNAYFNFQLEPERWKKKDWGEFSQRYDYWQGKAAYPDLVKSIVFIENAADAEPLVYSPEKKTFGPAGVPDEFAALRQRFTNNDTFRPVYEDVPALVLPIHDHEEHLNKIMVRTRENPADVKMEPPKRYGFLVMFLDLSVIREKVLPELTHKYFPDGEFMVGVSGKNNSIFQSGPIGSTDAQARLLDLSPDKFIFFANRDLVPPDGGQKREVFVNQQVERQTLSKIPGNSGSQGTIRVEVNSGERPRTTILERTNEGEDSGWTLNVGHRDGSIAAYVASQQRKSLATGFGILLLLGAGISIVYFSAMRARRFAQRQIDFVSSVSHEFRTPLAVIYSASENLEDGVAKDQQQVSRYGSLIKNEGKKLSAMVEQILEFAGANSGRQKYSFTETNVNDVIDSAISECSALIGSADFTVEKNVQESLPAILADHSALSRAVGNLIANSIKYGNGSTWIRVSAENGGGTVKIRVEDKGIGIESKDLVHIFEPFYRSKEVVDAQIHGNGLGLSLVKQIADAHRGKVSVTSKPGHGSEFAIEIPLN